MKHKSTLLALTVAAIASVATCNANAANAVFANHLSDNSTGFADTLFLGPPDGSPANDESAWVGIGGQVVTYVFGNLRVVEGEVLDHVHGAHHE